MLGQYQCKRQGEGLNNLPVFGVINRLGVLQLSKEIDKISNTIFIVADPMEWIVSLIVT
jgi:hypothetical protein